MTSYDYILSAVSILVGALISWVLATRKKLNSSSIDFLLVDLQNAEAPRDISLLYDGKDVKRLMVSRMAIWNGGNTTIQGQDVKRDIRIVVDGENVTLLEARILGSTGEESNSFRLTKDPDSARLQFDFWDPRDGLVVEIRHNGTGIYLDGKIMGLPAFRKKHASEAARANRAEAAPEQTLSVMEMFSKIARISGSLAAGMGPIFLGAALCTLAPLRMLSFLHLEEDITPEFRITTVLLCLASEMFGYWLAWLERSRGYLPYRFRSLLAFWEQ